MASNYGLQFGFRRSDESLSVREGRFAVPATGTFRQGQGVIIDPAAPGFLKNAPATSELAGGGGLLVQEEVHIRALYGNLYVNTADFGKVVNGRLAIIWSGPGCKVWLRNVAGYPAIVGAGLAVGASLAWDGTIWTAAGANPPFMRVTESSGSAGSEYVEATVLK